VTVARKKQAGKRRLPYDDDEVALFLGWRIVQRG
jgi:hypothetical protein